ncbi:MAG: pilus assembly protein PilM [Candidatus Paceibacterota bacterium]
MTSNEFLHFFPAPTFLQMPTAGLDIADGEIRFIELREDRGVLGLQNYGMQKIANDVIEEGSIEKKEELVAALTKIREENGLKFVRVSLPEEKSYVFHTTVPYAANPDEMRDAISFTIEENVPLSAENVVFDYNVIGRKSVKVSEDVDVAVSALPINVVEMYIDVIRSSGLRPMSLMVESQAIARSVVPKENPNSFLVINIDTETSVVYIVNNNTVHFTSAFPTKNAGSSVLTSSTSITQEGELVDNKEDSISEEDTFFSNASEILAEVKRVYDYWHSRGIGSQKDNQVKKFLICGDHALDKQFQKKLAETFSVDVETANVWINAMTFDESVPEIPVDEALRYAAAIGLALPQNI